MKEEWKKFPSERAIWNSRKGYSRPGEIVEVIERRAGKVLIRSAPDDERELQISPRGFDYWVLESELTPLKDNPSIRAEIAQGKKLGQAFSGHRYNRAAIVREKTPSGVRVAIGPVTGIMYLAKRDGKTEQYLHRFAEKSRPLLATTSDGSRLELLGGAFRFTDRGIVDEPVKVRPKPRQKRS